MDRLDLVLDTPVARIGTFREVFITVWYIPGTPEVIRAHNAAQRAFARKLGAEKMVAFSILHPGTVATMNGDARRAVEEGVREITPYTKASAVVVGVSGFAAAALRSLIAGLMLLSRSGYPTRVFDREEAACEWVAGLLAPDAGRLVTAADLRAACRAVDERS